MDLSEALLRSADLTGASLECAVLVRTNCENAVLSDCNVYGMSVWDVNLTDAVQSNLVITPEDQPRIQVDNLQVAQFIYLLLNNENVRHVIDTIASKVVLILGRLRLRGSPYWTLFVLRYAAGTDCPYCSISKSRSPKRRTKPSPRWRTCLVS